MTLLNLIKPYIKSILVILLVMFIANLAGLALPWGMKMVIDQVLLNEGKGAFNLIMAGLVIALLLRIVFSFLRKHQGYMVGEKIVRDLRKKIYWETHRKSLLSIRNFSPVQLLTRVTTDVESVRSFILNEAVDFIYAVFNVVFILGLLAIMNWRLALLTGGLVPLFAAVYLGLLPGVKDCYGSTRKAYADLTERVNEVFNGMNIIRAFCAETSEKNIFDQRQENLFSAAVKAHRVNIWLWLAIDSFTSAAMLGVLMFGGHEVLSGRMSVGELVAFYAYLMMVFSPLIRVVVINNSFQDVRAAMDRIQEIFLLQDQPPESTQPVFCSTIKGDILCDQLSFGYCPGQQVLKGISFSIKSGETTAIVGVSGVGKTTLVNLLLRFFDPDDGKIIIDGINLKALDIRSFRKQIAVVLQDDFLFHDTVANNISYGCADISHDEIEKAAKAAQAHSFIMALPDRYQTRIGDRGCRLSSGQRQRLAIARSLVRRPKILILDEATSAVDALTENAIQHNVTNYLPGATIIIVAHRFSTIMNADKIIVIDKGRILEEGTHDELLKKTGLYFQLYSEQFERGVVKA